MAWNRTDTLLYAAIFISAYYAYHTVPDILNHIRNLAACPEPLGPGPKKQLQKDAENTIAIDTLKTLSDGHSHDLRASTIKIVAYRTIRSHTKKLLLRDLASNDQSRRYKAIDGLRLLTFNASLYSKQIRESFLNHNSFRPIVIALKNTLAEHRNERPSEPLVPEDQRYPEPELPPSPVRPAFRPYQERRLLIILIQLLETIRSNTKGHIYIDNVTCVLYAGLVTDWLKDYPFPCTLPQYSKFNPQNSDVYSFFVPRLWHHDDPDEMDLLMSIINRSALGRLHLTEAGLRKPSQPENDEIKWEERRREIFRRRISNGESDTGAATPPPVALSRRSRSFDDGVPRNRPVEISPEEERLRRRRREAVVIAEPGEALDHHNILQRTHSE